MERLVEIALRYRILVLIGVPILAVAGVVAMKNLPMDAEPDITPNQVLVLTRPPVCRRLRSNNCSPIPSRPR
jgi:cobalt-zinc-cadmium resistance protein CzcA